MNAIGKINILSAYLYKVKYSSALLLSVLACVWQEAAVFSLIAASYFM